MAGNRFARLSDRGVVSVSGPDAEPLLQGLITNDMARLGDAPAIHAGLLTPQGKILFAFFAVRTAGGYLLETPAHMVADLAKRLAFYRLRAKAEIVDASDRFGVIAVWAVGEAPDSEAPDLGPQAGEAIVWRDPRAPGMGLRLLVAATDIEGTVAALRGQGLEEMAASEYDAHRIACGVAEIGADYGASEVFPHEANFDVQHGVDFRKGCFVGQEVVSRMQHKAVVRKRFVAVEGQAPLPDNRAEITAGAATLGRLGSVAGRCGLALVRLDRAVESEAAGAAPAIGAQAIQIAPDALEGYRRRAGERQTGDT